jgi:hypothetical protein
MYIFNTNTICIIILTDETIDRHQVMTQCYVVAHVHESVWSF